MFKKILIVGCGLIGSSILRATIKKKISKKIFILEKSNKKTKIQLRGFKRLPKTNSQNGYDNNLYTFK